MPDPRPASFPGLRRGGLPECTTWYDQGHRGARARRDADGTGRLQSRPRNPGHAHRRGVRGCRRLAHANGNVPSDADNRNENEIGKKGGTKARPRSSPRQWPCSQGRRHTAKGSASRTARERTMKRRACINDRKTRKTPTTAALTRRASANERPESRCASAGRYKQGSSRARKTKRSNSNHRRRHGAEQTQSVLTGDEELPVSQVPGGRR